MALPCSPGKTYAERRSQEVHDDAASPAARRLGRRLAVLAGSAAQAFTLNILHFNDFHSRIESINAFDSTCSAEDEAAGECFGGAARLVHRGRRRSATS